MSDEFEIKQMLKQHIEASDKYRNESQQAMARIEVHNEYTKAKLTDHETCINDLKTAHDKQKGAIWVFGLIGLGGLVEVIREWVK
jgi:hypothetical protein